jgi:hypothetical protein
MDTLTFEIIEGNVNNAFTIDQSSRSLIVKNSDALDYETTPQFHLKITGTDGEFADTASMDVYYNQNEKPHIPDLCNYC